MFGSNAHCTNLRTSKKLQEYVMGPSRAGNLDTAAALRAAGLSIGFDGGNCKASSWMACRLQSRPFQEHAAQWSMDKDYCCSVHGIQDIASISVPKVVARACE